MQKNPERVAWTVLTAAFIAFCVLASGIPLGIRWYLLTSTDDQDSLLQVIEGTVLVQKAEGSEPLGVTESAAMAPEDEVITDATSWCTLDLFERSHVTLYSNGKVKLGRVVTPRFKISKAPNEVVLGFTGGLMRVGVALPGERPTHFEVQTPHCDVQLEEGSYRIEVTNDGTQVTVVRGRAAIESQGVRMTIPQGTRTSVDLTGHVMEPLPAARNLVENGDFTAILQGTWVTDTVVLTTSVAPPRVEMVEEGSRRAVRLVRREADDGIHSEVSIHQRLDQDVRDFVQLAVSLDVLLNFQSLSGGGLLSSEFPIIVRLDYKDLWGNDKFWTHGFYYQNRNNYPIAPDPWGRPSGEQVPQGVWYPYESDNLLELLGDNRPAYITGLTIYASGWNYDSQVTEAQVIVE